MKINRYQYIGKNKYQVWIDEIPYTFYEDVIIESDFLTKKEVTQEFLKGQEKKNEFYKVYEEMTKFLNKKVCPKKDIIKKLDATNLSDIDKEKMLLKLINSGYLNDKVYARAYIHNAILFELLGPNKLKEELLTNTDLSYEEVEKELEEYTKEIIDKKLKKYIEKQARLNKKSIKIFKNTITQKLLFLGFSSSDIDNALDNLSLNEDDLYQKEKEKQLRILSKKYQGKELEFQLKKKLYAKGFTSFE